MDLGMVGLGQLSLSLPFLPPDPESALLPRSPPPPIQLTPWLSLGRTFSPRVLSAAGPWATGGPREEEQPFQFPNKVGVHLASDMEMGRSVTTSLPGSLVASKPPIRDLPVPEPQYYGPQERNAVGPRREEGRRPRPPWPPCPAAFTHPALPPSPCHAPCHPFHRSLGSEWCPPWPHPHPSGARGMAGT